MIRALGEWILVISLIAAYLCEAFFRELKLSLLSSPSELRREARTRAMSRWARLFLRNLGFEVGCSDPHRLNEGELFRRQPPFFLGCGCSRELVLPGFCHLGRNQAIRRS